MKRKVFKGIKQWMEQYARTLELVRFQYLFERGSKENYYKELMKYQNRDGGFGYGLEPDSTNPYSTPIQTWMAFELILELKLPKNDPMVKNTINYLTQTPFFENGFWYATIPSNDQYPHAPWWSFKEESKIWGYNPTAAIAGFMYKNALKEANKLFSKEIIQRAIDDFLKGDFDEMHELRNFIELYEYIKDVPLFQHLDKFKVQLDRKSVV